MSMVEEDEIQVLGTVPAEPPKPRRRSLAPPRPPPQSQQSHRLGQQSPRVDQGRTEAAEEQTSEADIRDGIEAAKKTLQDCLSVQEELDDKSLDLGDEEATDEHMESTTKVREKILALETEIRRHEAELERRGGGDPGAQPEQLLTIPPIVRFGGPAATTHVPEMDVWLQAQVNKNRSHNRNYYLPVSDDVLAQLRALRGRSPKLRQKSPGELEAIAAHCLDVATRLVREQRNRQAAESLDELYDVQQERLLRTPAVSEEDKIAAVLDPASNDRGLEQRLKDNHSGHVRRLEDMQSKLAELADDDDDMEEEDADEDEDIMEIPPPPVLPAPKPSLYRPRSLARHPNYAGPPPLNWSPASKAAASLAQPLASLPIPLNRLPGTRDLNATIMLD
jgi:uncharacterized small protein (DUF1192 family)